MYAQLIHLRIPLDQLSEVRRLIEVEYLPVVSKRPGFKSGYLLEHVDDSNSAHLVILWDNYQVYEQYRQTTLLSGSDQSIAARIPGLRMERHECIIHVANDTLPTAVR